MRLALRKLDRQSKGLEHKNDIDRHAKDNKEGYETLVLRRISKPVGDGTTHSRRQIVQDRVLRFLGLHRAMQKQDHQAAEDRHRDPIVYGFHLRPLSIHPGTRKPGNFQPILPVRCPIGQHKLMPSNVCAATGRRRQLLVPALLLGFGLSACGTADSLGAAGSARAGTVVALVDGRKLNFRCQGRGTPTVLLESGFGADSTAWYKVQPDLARQTRVCAYDRAGYGYSDPGPLPRDGAATARDLDLALKAAGIKGPFVVMGHSAGGLYARLFAARRTSDVQGLILLDPTVERLAPRPEADGLNGMRQRLQKCLAMASAPSSAAIDDPQWAECVAPTKTEHQVSAARRPATWQNQLSELNSIFGRTSEQVGRIGPILRDIPLYVITASETAAGSPRSVFGAHVSMWELQHLQIASTSQHGFQTTVVSPHLVMIARPDVAIAAAREMIAASRENRLPGPLPASEPLSAPQSENSAGGFSTLRKFGLNSGPATFPTMSAGPAAPFTLD